MKKVFKRGIVVASLLALTIQSGIASADIVVDESAGTRTAESEATITFTNPENPQDILDPENPDPNNPIDPETDLPGGGNQTGDTGPLTLDYVTNLNFGEREVSIASRAISLNDAVHTKSPFVQITDLRGDQSGWNLKASLAEFKFNGTQGTSLAGANITLKNAVVKNAIGNVSTKAEPNTDITLESGGASELIANAAENTGKGTSLVVWNKDNIKLNTVQGTEKVGSHKAAITWTLSNVPNE